MTCHHLEQESWRDRTCPVETMKEVIDKMNMTEITSVYGLTEASPGMTQTNAADTFEKKVNTVGTPFPNVEVKLIRS